jgi:hypothetical protein
LACLEPGDLLLTLGAGNIVRAGEQLLHLLTARTKTATDEIGRQ